MTTVATADSSATQAFSGRSARLRAAAGGFLGFGAFIGLLDGAAPALQARMNLSDGALGTLLSAPLLVAVLAMGAVPRLLARHGNTVVLQAALVAFAATAVGIALAPSTWSLLVIIVVWGGVATGFAEVSVNASAIDAAAEHPMPVLGYLHGGFNVGATAAVLLTSALQDRGASLSTLALSVGCLIVLFLLGTRGATARQRPTISAQSERVAASKVAALPILSGLGALALLVEATATTWPVVYAVSYLGVSPLIGGGLFFAFQAAMIGGRTLYAPLATRFSGGAIATMCGVVLVAGAVTAFSTTVTWLSAAGFFLCGLAVASLLPAVMQTVGQVAGEAVSSATATVTRVGYAGLFLGPWVCGLAADATSLRVGLFGVLAASGIAIAVLGTRLSRASG